MAHYPAVSIFAIDDTILAGHVWDQLVRQCLLETPSRLPLYALRRAGISVRKKGPGVSKMAAGLWLYSKLDQENRDFVRDYVVDRMIREALRPGAVDTLIRRRKAGDRIVLMTACFDLIAAPLAARLGGADILATPTLPAGDSGRIMMDKGASLCVGQERFRRLRLMFDGGRRPPFIRAYSADTSDLDLLRWADVGAVINPGPAAAEKAQASGLTILDWTVGMHDAPVHRPSMPHAPASNPQAGDAQPNTSDKARR